jgi:flagellar motor switch protein FliN/FliY
MTQLTDEQIQRTIDTCREHLVEVAESFRTALGCEIRLSAGEPSPVGAASDLADFQVPGLAVSMVVGEEGLLVLIPHSLPLPAWYRQPDISQNNRLQTFAQELSLHLLPADLLAKRYLAIPTENLIEVAQNAHAASSAKMVELAVFHPDGTHEAAFAKVLLIVPVTTPPVLPAAQSTAHDVPQTNAGSPAGSDEAGPEATEFSDSQADESEAAFDEAEFEASADEFEEARSVTADADAALRALRILRVPVTVSVRLAERKMSLGTVVALVPGSLVTFSKSCEDLLDLYVNNHRYCQGEAIKIGESFGLKVSKVGVAEDRRERIV